MENVKKWSSSNWSTLILVIVFVTLLVSPDAKAWLMRQVASTGVLNSGMSRSEIKDDEATAIFSYADFTLKDPSGTKVHLYDLKGKVVFINFWASWCPPCRAEFPSIQKFYEKYRSHPDVAFITVNLDDDPVLGQKYMEEKGFTIPFLRPASAVPKTLYDGTLPTTVVLDKKGKIRLHHKGLADYSKDSFYTDIDVLVKETGL
ncbi:TlpA family protein disulfide reductase [Chryseobacterium pennipullorum]|uniref:TlpA family protein disulfide reductase n=1 Tax=Chryseobacterium pennipullorum TaxID=2258963 RepID=A0A3D9B1I7_9FLAO|nr:TlpA disulfide reductase family protein [Chryseobacterium pennipullorum]REC47484.1 TlpA family protein disulfide reductase [Chryseobacterium pennipullorum]